MTFIKETLNEIKEILVKQKILNKEILTLEEVAKYLQLSKSRLYKLTSEKAIPHYKPSGKTIYFKRSEVDDWIFNSKVLSVDELENKTEQYLSNNGKS